MGGGYSKYSLQCGGLSHLRIIMEEASKCQGAASHGRGDESPHLLLKHLMYSKIMISAKKINEQR